MLYYEMRYVLETVTKLPLAFHKDKKFIIFNAMCQQIKAILYTTKDNNQATAVL